MPTAQSSRVHLRSRKTAIALSLTITILSLILLSGQDPFFTGTDYFAWGQDANALADCYKSQDCYLSKFPPAYILNSFLINSSIKAGQTANTALLAINLSFLFLFIATLRFHKIWKDPVIPTIFIASVMATPLPSFYIYSGALELQSGLALSLWLLLFAYREKAYEVPLFISVFLASIYKDTNPLLLGILLAAATIENILILKLWKRKFSHLAISRRLFYRKLRASTLGIAASASLMAYYNYIRYGDLLPRDYIHEALHRSPGIHAKLTNLAGLILSPNGGIISFWGLACLFLFAIFNFEYRYLYGSVLIALITTIIGLASWWAPFGWNAWGSRLTIPSILMTLSIACFTGRLREPLLLKKSSRNNRSSHKRIGSIFLSITVIIPIVLISSPFIVKTYTSGSNEEKYYDYLYGTIPCKEMQSKESKSQMGDLFWRSPTYYDCVKARLWKAR